MQAEAPGCRCGPLRGPRSWREAAATPGNPQGEGGLEKEGRPAQTPRSEAVSKLFARLAELGSKTGFLE